MKYIALLLLLLIGCTGNVVKEDTTTVGFIGPLTGNVATVYGEVARNSVSIASEEVGVNVLYEDVQCDGAQAASAALKLITEDKVDALIVICSAEVMAAAPIAKQYNIPLIAPASNTDELSHFPEVFRLSFANSKAGEITAHVLEEYETVGVLTEQSAYAQSLEAGFLNAFEGRVTVERYLLGVQDLRTQISKMQNTEAIFLNPESESTGRAALKILNEVGYEGKVVTNWFGALVDNITYVAEPTPKDTTKKEAFFATYRERYGEPALPFIAITSYDAAYLLEEALQHEDPQTYLKTHTFNGALGMFSFDKQGDVVGIEPEVYN